MESNDIITIVIMAVLVLLSAYFSATETAFSSLNRIRIKTMAEDGNKSAALVNSMSDKFDRLLSTVLIGNNIVNISLTSIATIFFIKNIGEQFGATVSTVVITIVVLVFGEITPKSLAKESPEQFAMFSVKLLRFMIIILTPLNVLFGWWKQFVNKLFRVNGKNTVTEDEILTMVGEAESDGEINEQESELIRSAIEFNDLDADEILTPRVDICAVENTDSNEVIAAVFEKTGYSRLPVFADSIDNIIGVINFKDFYSAQAKQNKRLKSITKPPVYITGSMKASDLLRLLQKTKSHIAVVVDEYGGTKGIVTMEDILEELVGEIWDEHDEIVNDIEKLADNSYKIHCTMDIDELADMLDKDIETDASTVGGWVMDRLGRIPAAGDCFAENGMKITVTKAEEKRVVEINLIILQESVEDDKD